MGTPPPALSTNTTLSSCPMPPPPRSPAMQGTEELWKLYPTQLEELLRRRRSEANSSSQRPRKARKLAHEPSQASTTLQAAVATMTATSSPLPLPLPPPPLTQVHRQASSPLHTAAMDAAGMGRAKILELESKGSRTLDSYYRYIADWIEWTLDNYAPMENGEHAVIVTPAKAHAFVTEQSMRARRIKARPLSMPAASPLELEEVLEREPTPPPFEETAGPIKRKTVNVIIASLIHLWEYQSATGINRHPHPRKAGDLPGLARKAELEQNSRSKAAFDNKHNRAQGYEAYQLPDICKYFLTKSHDAVGLRAFANQTLMHACLLRGEALRAAELSDLFLVNMGQPGEPGHQPIVCLQMSSSKTNKVGKVQTVGFLRHRNALRCPVFALALYLFYRFHMTTEGFPDLSCNESWYQTKVLIKAGAPMKEVDYSTQADQIKLAFKAVGIHYPAEITHAARGAGAREIDDIGVALPDIERHGLWKDVQSSLTESYINNVPRSALRAMAGFAKDGHDFHQPRAKMVPPCELAKQIFPQVDQRLAEIERDPQAFAAASAGKRRDGTSNRGNGHSAYTFCLVLKYLRTVLLQDIHILQEVAPQHSVLKHRFFRSYAFQTWLLRQKAALGSLQAPPLDERLERLAPGVAAQMRVHASMMYSHTTDLSLKLADFEKTMAQTAAGVGGQVSALEVSVSALARRFSGWERSQVDVLGSQARTAQLRQDHLTTLARSAADEILQAQQALQARTESLAAETGQQAARGGSADSPQCVHKLNPAVTTLQQAWEEYDVGYAGARPLRELEAELGAHWCGGSKTAERKRWTRRWAVLQRLAQLAPSERPAEIARLMAAMQAHRLHSLDQLRKALEKGTIT